MMWADPHGERELQFSKSCESHRIYYDGNITVKRGSRMFIHILGSYCNVQVNLEVPNEVPINKKGVPRKNITQDVDFGDVRIITTYNVLKRNNALSITNGIGFDFQNCKWWQQSNFKRCELEKVSSIDREMNERCERLSSHLVHMEKVKKTISDLQAQLIEMECQKKEMNAQIVETSSKRKRLVETFSEEKRQKNE